MVIIMEDLGDCFQVGSLPWDRHGSVSFTGCEEDDINVDPGEWFPGPEALHGHAVHDCVAGASCLHNLATDTGISSNTPPEIRDDTIEEETDISVHLSSQHAAVLLLVMARNGTPK